MIAVVITTYAEDAEVTKCIDAILKQTVFKQLKIVVINNNSCFDTFQHIAPYVKHGIDAIGLPQNIGRIRAPDLAFRYLELQDKYSHFVSIDADMLVEPDTLEKLRILMSANPVIGLLSPMYIRGTDHNNILEDAIFIKGKAKEIPSLIPNFMRMTPRVVEACFMVSRACYKAFQIKHQGIFMTTVSTPYSLAGGQGNDFMRHLKPMGFQFGYHKDAFVQAIKNSCDTGGPNGYLAWKRKHRANRGAVTAPVPIGEGFYDA
ncbi:MAG: glycosyltransferase family 2 protein [Deltaproteobacteria bacterium]|nr:glycosyltransferase family 2 protein [Deltaproteobacteria bacterium]